MTFAWVMFVLGNILGITAASLDLKEAHDRYSRGDQQNVDTPMLMAWFKVCMIPFVYYTTSDAHKERTEAGNRCAKIGHWTPFALLLVGAIFWAASAGEAMAFDIDRRCPVSVDKYNGTGTHKYEPYEQGALLTATAAGIILFTVVSWCYYKDNGNNGRITVNNGVSPGALDSADNATLLRKQPFDLFFVTQPPCSQQTPGR